MHVVQRLLRSRHLMLPSPLSAHYGVRVCVCMRVCTCACVCMSVCVHVCVCAREESLRSLPLAKVKPPEQRRCRPPPCRGSFMLHNRHLAPFDRRLRIWLSAWPRRPPAALRSPERRRFTSSESLWISRSASCSSRLA